MYTVTDKKGQAIPRVEAMIADLGGDAEGYAREMRRLLDATARTNDGQSIVISFTEDEFPSAGEHGQEVAETAYEVVRRGAPDAPLLVVAQRDGAGGRWHAHVIVGNHDMATGKANRGAWKHDQWRLINDAYNRESGLAVCGQEAALSRVERVAKARGIELQADADLVALTPTEVPKNDVDRYLGSLVMDALLDGHLDRLPDDGGAVTVPIPAHDGYSLSVRAKGTGLSYAVVDDDGAPVMCAAGARGGKPRRIASTGTKLDSALAKGRGDATYTRPGMTELLAALEEEKEREQQREEEARTAESRAGDSERVAGRDDERTGDRADDRTSEPSIGPSIGADERARPGGGSLDPRPAGSATADRQRGRVDRLGQPGAGADDVAAVAREPYDRRAAERDWCAAERDALAMMRTNVQRKSADGTSTPVTILDVVHLRAAKRYDADPSLTADEALRAALADGRSGVKAGALARREAAKAHPGGVPTETCGEKAVRCRATAERGNRLVAEVNRSAAQAAKERFVSRASTRGRDNGYLSM